MFNKPFDQITESDIQELIDNKIPEGRKLEYKQRLPGNGDSDKKEFLHDVASFANTEGGDLL